MRRMKSTIRQLPIVGEIARWTNGAIRRWQYGTAAEWLANFVRSPTASVVQIGSNDGKTNDPIHTLLQRNSQWSALFVEPVPYLFERLKENYGVGPRFQFINAAINNGQVATFYWVDESAKTDLPHLPDWYDQLGSFCRDHIVNHLDGVLEPYIRKTEISGISLPDLFRQNDVEHVDILHIDTEGSDWQILSQLELEEIAPSVVLYEHKHLSPSDKSESLEFLKSKYDIFHVGDDFLAVNKVSKQRTQSVPRRLQRQKLLPPELA